MAQWPREVGAASAAVLAALFLGLSGTAQAGINDTKHNLGSGTGPTGRNQVTDTAEVCVFCHTPHGGSTTAPVPLWNKRLGANGTPAGGGSYTTYASLQTPSLDGSVAPVGGISLACLSCHDGTQAMDNIINSPGSGGLNADGGGTNGQAFTWNTGGTVNAVGQLTSGAALIGTDLSNDHPIGIQYCGGGMDNTGAITNCRDQDFNPATTATINGNQSSGSIPARPARSSAPTCRCTCAPARPRPPARWWSAAAATTRTSRRAGLARRARTGSRARPSCASPTPTVRCALRAT
ncbi:hypothetical protein FSC37_00795 [Piscinibacter aquaticus]|uniref:Doubled CXXCH motif domain-containing protein n=1 Tax=Piscinibacter aquaticus TaxID=392597 RepID=A0A5C6TXQ9_9BURK|nr:hypothetical protein FSC37_00795 [Piscinibacter aquaticus]